MYTNKGKESTEAFEELPLAFQAELSLENVLQGCNVI